jgi:hypothetical protein
VKEQRKIWKDVTLHKMVRDVSAEMGVMRIVGCKNKEQWLKIGIYMINYKEKWKDDH